MKENLVKVEGERFSCKGCALLTSNINKVVRCSVAPKKRQFVKFNLDGSITNYIWVTKIDDKGEAKC